MKFNKLEIKEQIKLALNELEITEMTEIQEKAIPVILDGNDCLGQAQTGTGKTFAFAIPILEKIDPRVRGAQALILAPTRELANQIENEFKKLSAHIDINYALVIGGVSYDRQIRSLRNAQVVIATPGRAKDMMDKKKLILNDIKFFVLDEADEMLKVGFKEEIDFIIDHLSTDTQRMLFSATTTEYTKKIAQKTLKNEVVVNVSSGLQATDSIEQKVIYVREGDKLKVFVRILDMNQNKKFVVFCRTKRRSDEITSALSELGYNARALHGDLVQQQRTQVMNEYKAGTFDILCCTDLAARGIDVEDIDYVINFDLPQEVEYYVHRIGRCGRAGRKGISISFVRDTEESHLNTIKRDTNSKITQVPQPSKKQVNRALVKQNLSKVEEQLKQENNSYNDVAAELLAKYGVEELVSALLELSSAKEHKNIPTLTPERPVSAKGGYKGRGRSRGNSSSRDRNHSGGGRDRDRKKSYSKSNGRSNSSHHHDSKSSNHDHSDSSSKRSNSHDNYKKKTRN